MSRSDRKNEHILYGIQKAPRAADFTSISLVHNCLPGLDLNDINLRTKIMGREVCSPLFINALTGGTPVSAGINAALAGAARVCGLPMAVGSQMAALENRKARAGFAVVRKVNPGGVVWANLGAYATPEMAARAAGMIRADGLQIHLNVPQELAMAEGDRRFRDSFEHISEIVAATDLPVSVKEVGFGIAREQAALLIEAGVQAIDVGGRGGSNFLEIESSRRGRKIDPGLCAWGIPTAISLVEVVETSRGRVDVFASGGMQSGLDAAKALALGASAVGLAGLPLYLLLRKGRLALIRGLKKIEQDLRMVMLMAGAADLAELRRKPLVITGYTAEWLERRGYDPSAYARR